MVHAPRPVTVKLLNAAGAEVATATTDANGNYLFSKPLPVDYKIQVVTPNGYTITGKDQGGNDAADSDIDSTGTTGLYTLAQGSNNLNVDAGFYWPAGHRQDRRPGVGGPQLQRHPGRGRSRHQGRHREAAQQRRPQWSPRPPPTPAATTCSAT